MGLKKSYSAASKIAKALQNDAIHTEDEKQAFGAFIELLKADCASSKTLPSVSELCKIISNMKNRSSESEEMMELIEALAQIFRQHHSNLLKLSPRPTASELCKAISGMRSLPLKLESVQSLLHTLGRLLSFVSETEKPSREDLNLALQGVQSMPADIKIVNDTMSLLRQITPSNNT